MHTLLIILAAIAGSLSLNIPIYLRFRAAIKSLTQKYAEFHQTRMEYAATLPPPPGNSPTSGIAINVATPINGTTTQISWTGTIMYQ